MISVSTFFLFNYLVLSLGLFGLTINGWILIIVMLSLSGAAMVIYMGAKNAGQFDDIEGVKYRMLIEKEDFHDLKKE